VIEAYGTSFRTPDERKFARVEDIQRYVDAVLAHVGHDRPVKVRVRKGITKAHYEHYNETIAIPENPWAMREIVVLHEIAHHLTKYSEPAHGPEFRSAFCDLLERVLCPEARFLLQVAFFERGLTA
jgi:putative metallohydrolase (TIGR04338 family)